MRKIFDNLAKSNWHLAISQTKTATHCRLRFGIGIGVTLESRKGHPSVTQGPRRGHPGVDWRKIFVCNKN